MPYIPQYRFFIFVLKCSTITIYHSTTLVYQRKKLTKPSLRINYSSGGRNTSVVEWDFVGHYTFFLNGLNTVSLRGSGKSFSLGIFTKNVSGTHNALYIPPRPLYTKTTQGFIYSLVRVGIEEKHESKRTKCNEPMAHLLKIGWQCRL